ncbi:hypothetical protein [Luteimonas qiangzhengi]|uniref:hypothetical protein n=1 Tax=Luteimonas sp. MJ146 TaxID=3129240 RepID=UPI0031BA7735
MTAQAAPLFIKRADADAGAEDSAERDIHDACTTPAERKLHIEKKPCRIAPARLIAYRAASIHANQARTAAAAAWIS